MISAAKLIEIGALMARICHSEDGTDPALDLYSSQLGLLDQVETDIAFFASKMLRAEKPYEVNTSGPIDPRYFEIAKMLGADAVPSSPSVLFVPPGVE
jgi:hypothetical protein